MNSKIILQILLKTYLNIISHKIKKKYINYFYLIFNIII